MKIAVCWKWVAVDGAPSDDGRPDRRWAGVSRADEAALEVALRCPQADVTVVAYAPGDADDVLRDGIAAGAHRAVRIDGPIASSSEAVAAAIAEVVDEHDVIVCGDYSLDRSTGSVPAFIAAILGRPQALGLVEVTVDAVGAIDGVRRLDGGRREVVAVTAPAVISVEGAVAALRRAPLAASISARRATIDVRDAPDPAPVAGVAPFGELRALRPRARSHPLPSGTTLDRIRQLLDLGGTEGPRAETVVLSPEAAAGAILGQLATWGYDLPEQA